MTAPPSRFYKIRVGFTLDDVYHPVAWFEPRNNDLYWGPSTPARYAETVQATDGVIQLVVPENLDQLPLGRAKYSYHQSGQTHLKIDGVMVGIPGMLARPRELRSPLYLGTFITRRADEYQPGTRPKPNAGHVLSLLLNEHAARCRHQLEFHLSPPGEHQMPAIWAVAPEPEPVLAPPPQYTQSISGGLILLVRHRLHEPGPFSDWAPDAEIWFPNPASNPE